jgi:hypothetical protein
MPQQIILYGMSGKHQYLVYEHSPRYASAGHNG